MQYSAFSLKSLRVLGLHASNLNFDFFLNLVPVCFFLCFLRHFDFTRQLSRNCRKRCFSQRNLQPVRHIWTYNHSCRKIHCTYNSINTIIIIIIIAVYKSIAINYYLLKVQNTIAIHSDSEVLIIFYFFEFRFW